MSVGDYIYIDTHTHATMAKTYIFVKKFAREFLRYAFLSIFVNNCHYIYIVASFVIL